MSLVLTRIQNIRANSNLDKFEYRPSRYGALNAFMVQSEDPTGILTEELKQKARTSIGNTLETPVIDYDADITIGNTRTLTLLRWCRLRLLPMLGASQLLPQCT